MKILIGYDGSKTADEAISDLKKAGLPKSAQVKILHAIPPLLPIESLAPNSEGVSWYASAYKEALENQKQTEASALVKVENVAQTLRKYFPDWKIASQICVDVPAHAILSTSEKWKADLIVLGSHGWNAVGKLIFGSVAEKVLNHAQCVVRLGRETKNVQTRPLRPPRLLIAFDGSKFAEAAVATVAERNWPKGTEVRVLAISDLQLRMGDISQALNRTFGRKDGLRSTWPWMEKKLARAAIKLEKSGLKAETSLVLGEPRNILLTQAKKSEIDTIFLGSRGISGLQRFLLGSVSSAVAAHAPCSVEIVH